MTNSNTATIPPAVRSWIYSVLTPVSALLVFYGITSEQESALWVALVTATVQGGTAIAYRPTRSAVPGDNPAAVDEGHYDTAGLLVSTAIAILVVVAYHLIVR